MRNLLLVVLCAFPLAAFAQQTRPESVPLSPPVNHESGLISDVLIARDGDYRQVGSIVRWRDAQIFVSSAPGRVPRQGENLDFTVYRSMHGGRKVLRFETSQESVS